MIVHCLFHPLSVRELRQNDMLIDGFQADDELESPYLAGFEWDRDECYTRFIVHQKKTGEAQSNTSSKKKNKKKDEE